MSADSADTLAVFFVRGSPFFAAAAADHAMHCVVGPRTLPVMGMIINTANGADFQTVNGMPFELGLTATVTFQGMASRIALCSIVMYYSARAFTSVQKASGERSWA